MPQIPTGGDGSIEIQVSGQIAETLGDALTRHLDQNGWEAPVQISIGLQVFACRLTLPIRDFRKASLRLEFQALEIK